MLINSVNLRDRPPPNMLEDLLNDDSGEGRSNEVYADRRPTYQRVTTTLTGSQNRKNSVEKQRRLEQLQHDYNDLRKKLNTVDRKNQHILFKLKNQTAERQRPRNDSQSPKRNVYYPAATPDNPENVRSLKQQIDMLQLQLKDKEMQLKERKLAHEQKEEFYRQLLHNQEQQIACLELTAEATLPMQRIAQSLQNQDFATSMFRDEVEHKLNRLGDRLARAISLVKRCGKMFKERRTRNSRQKKQVANNELTIFKDKQIDTIIGEYESTQKKMVAERKQLQQELELKRQELDQERDKFDRLGEELKEKYSQLLAAAEQRHAESLDRYCREVTSLKSEPEQTKQNAEATALTNRLNRKVQELERKLQTKELTCHQQSQYNQQLKQDMESMRESLTRIRFQKENLTFQLEKLRLNHQTTYEYEHNSNDSGELSAQYTAIKEENDSLRQQNTSLQRENFELQLKHRKLEELKRQLEDIYKGRLLEETQQNVKYREQRGKLQGEISQLRMQIRQKAGQQEDSDDQLQQVLKELVEEYNDPFISLVWQQYQQELPQAVIEISKGLKVMRSRQKDESKRIQESVQSSGFMEIKEHSTTVDIVQRLIRNVQEGKSHHERDKLAWRTLQETLSGKITKLQAQVKKLTNMKPQPQPKPAVPTGPSPNLQSKLADMRKETEKKELLSKIEILQFDLQTKQDELTELRKGKEAAISERDRMLVELRRQVEEKSKELHEQSTKMMQLQSTTRMPFQPTSPTKSDFLLDQSNDELDRLNEELAIAAQKLKLAQSRTEELEFSNQRLQDTCEELRIQTRKQAEEIISKSAKVSSLENIQRELTAGRKSDDSDRHKLEEEAQSVRQRLVQLLKLRQALEAREKQLEGKVKQLEVRTKELEKHNLQLVEMRQKQFAEREKLAKIRKSNEELIEKRLNNKLEETERLKQELKAKQESETETKVAVTKLQKELFQIRLELQEKNVTIFSQVDLIALLRSEKQGLECVHNEFRETYMEKVKKHKGRCKQANITIDKLKENVQSLTQENYKLEDSLTIATEKILALENEKAKSLSPGDIANAMQKMAFYESRVTDTYEQLNRLIAEKNAQEQEYLRVLNENGIMKATVIELQDEQADAGQRAALLAQEIARLKAKIGEYQQDIEDRHKLDEQIEQELLRLNARNEQLEGHVSYLSQQLQQMQQNNQNVQMELNEHSNQQIKQVQEPVQQPFEMPRPTDQEDEEDRFKEVEEDIFGIAEEPYVPNRGSSGSDQVDFIELFLRVKSAVERILDEGEISVEFYSLLPVQLEKPFEQLIEAIKVRIRSAGNSFTMPPIEQAHPQHSIEQILDDIPQEMFEDALQHHSTEVLVQKLKESQEQIDELRWKSENHQRTIEQIEHEQQEKQEEQETRHIIQLTLLKKQLKDCLVKVDSLELLADSTKRCFFKIIEICFSEDKTLLEDLAEAFNHLNNTAQLSEKQHGQLVTWFQQYRKNAETLKVTKPSDPAAAPIKQKFFGWFRSG